MWYFKSTLNSIYIQNTHSTAISYDKGEKRIEKEKKGERRKKGRLKSKNSFDGSGEVSDELLVS